MINFLIQRSIAGLLVLLGVVFIIFFLLNVIPINSAQLIVGQNADEATIEATEKKLRLNYSATQRLWFYLSDIAPLSVQSHTNADAPLSLLSGNYNYLTLFKGKEKSLVLKAPFFGRSFQTDKPVVQVLKSKLLPTFVLASLSILLASVIGISLGILAAMHYNSALDRMIMGVSVLGVSVPSYFAALLLAVGFGFYLSNYTGLNVTGAFVDISDTGNYFLNWRNLILPVIALGIRPVAIIMQLSRNSMLDVLRADYVRTATAKGLSKKIVIYKHALRNALNPVLTSITGWFAELLAGAFFVEYIFDFKGLGYETVRALTMFDYPMVMGAVFLIAFFFVVMNILVDVLYTLVDPRVRLA